MSSQQLVKDVPRPVPFNRVRHKRHVSLGGQATRYGHLENEPSEVAEAAELLQRPHKVALRQQCSRRRGRSSSPNEGVIKRKAGAKEQKRINGNGEGIGGRGTQDR